MNSDWELLERYRAEGTEEAFGELVARHVHWIHSAARRQVGDDDLAKDVTQMVFSDLARKAHSLSRATALSTLPIPGTGFLSTIALMNLKAVTVTLAALGVGTSILLLVRSNRELRHSKENLEVQVVGLSRELADVRSETSGRHLQDSHGAESKAELLRLRGEIAKLRRNEGDTRRQPVDRSAEGGEEPTAVLADAGTDTPEAAATTSLWVFTQGLRERLSELLTEDPNVSPEVVVKRQDFFFDVMTNAFANRMMTGIGRVRTNQDGSFDVYYAFRDRETGESNNVKLLMRPSETGWRVDPGNPPEGL